MVFAVLKVVVFASLCFLVGQIASADADPGLLYDNLVMSGNEPQTGDFSWGYCTIWVETFAARSYHDGMQRNNPDNTFYPGDGFSYGFAYGWAGDESKCQNFSVCPIVSMNISPGSTRCTSKNPVHEKAPYGGKVWFTAGDAEISADENAANHFISLQISAERWGCYHPRGGKVSCGWSTFYTTGSYSPPVIRPIVDIEILQEYLNDIDGYKSGNIDGTYYLHDAINLVHNPLYQWKDQRAGTITIKVTKQYDLLLEEEFQCEKTSCDHTVSHRGFEPWGKTYEYGMGETLLNATSNKDIRVHTITYRAELLNLGKPIHHAENKKDILVVTYEPKFESYPYLILKDEYWWSWGNRAGVALKYLGSHGGGADDTNTIHKNRRSKINSFQYYGYAFDPILPRHLNQSLLWSFAGPAEPLGCGASSDAAVVESKKDTVMFVSSGFGKIGFYWPIIYQMLDKRYINATIHNTLQSENFAGLAQKNLTDYTYQYPDVKFSNPVKILTYRSDGTRTDLPVSISMAPDFDMDAIYTSNYTCSKIIHDTKSQEIAGIAVGDMYGMSNVADGTGYINMKSRMISTWFAPFYHVLVNDILDLPLDEGYKAISPYEITITVGNTTKTLHRMVNFMSPFVHVVNLDSDNKLNVTEDAGIILINADERFGQISRVLVNGEELQKDCTNGCTTTSNSELDIVAFNEWGGRAAAHLDVNDHTEPEYRINWEISLVAITVAMFGFVAWNLGIRGLDYLGFRRRY